MFVKKETIGGAASPVHGAFQWVNDGDIVEVPDEWGAELLAIPDGGYSYVDAADVPKKRGRPAKMQSGPVTPETPEEEAAETPAQEKTEIAE